jgi:exoribonuclease II
VLGSEINAAAELLEADDPDLQAEGIALLEQYLAAQESTKTALAAKADRLLIFCDHKIQRSAFLKAQAKRLKEHADREDAVVARLQEYLIKVITTLHPNETRFSFDTHELTSRKSTSLDSSDAVLGGDNPDDVITRVNRTPDGLIELTFSFFAGDIDEQFIVSKLERRLDANAIKQAIKAGQGIEGCKLVEKRNWTVE